MSELMNVGRRPANLRWQLLVSASALALVSAVATQAKAEDTDKPTVWIELGGGWNRLDTGHETFDPEIFSSRPSIFSPSEPLEKPPLHGFEETGKLTFQPNASSWSFSASVRYGRSQATKSLHQQTYPLPFYKYTSGGQKSALSRIDAEGGKFADTATHHDESHLVVDFQAGKDVGLGMFGTRDGISVLGLGVRFAQFNSKANTQLRSDPDWHFNLVHYSGQTFLYGQPFHSFAASLDEQRSFHGVGPSLSWNASSRLAGNAEDSELMFDWGLNASVLFGRQKAKVHHQTTGRYHSKYNNVRPAPTPLPVTYQPTPVNKTRSRSVVVPNIGGFAGLSVKYPNAKLSVGYRADFFFGAMDTGIDTRSTSNVGFHGPFASVSIGLGG